MALPRLQTQTPVPDGYASLVVVLQSLADELERTRALGLRVEGAICAIAVRSAIDGSVVAELQQLDAVLQQVAALRDFAAHLATQCEPSVRIEIASALERVTLGEVRTRLGGVEMLDDTEDGWEIM